MFHCRSYPSDHGITNSFSRNPLSRGLDASSPNAETPRQGRSTMDVESESFASLHQTKGERMTAGYLYMVLSLLSFSLIGIFAKFADTKGCKPSAVYTLAYAWSALFGVVFVLLFS